MAGENTAQVTLALLDAVNQTLTTAYGAARILERAAEGDPLGEDECDRDMLLLVAASLRASADALSRARL